MTSRSLLLPIVVLGLAVLVLFETERGRPVTPWPVRLVGGARLTWTPGLESLWTETMRCTGLRPAAPDSTLALWALDARIPARLVGDANSIDQYLGLYLPDAHAVFVAPHADQAAIWRHEFVHAALRSPDTTHGPVFTQYGRACGLWPAIPGVQR